MSRTILIMAGGTGGHIFPALAVADALKAQGFDVIWLGTRQGMEAKLVPAKGYEIEYVKMSGVRKSGLGRWLMLPFTLTVACLQGIALMLRRRPDVVLGMGGFAAFPGGLAAALLGRPLVIHEQNAVAGLTNRVLSKLAKRTLVAFPGVLKGGEFVGNPVRSEISGLPSDRFENRTGRLKLLVMGGSRGARAINACVPAAVAKLPEASRPEVRHQTGESDLDSVRRAYREQGCSAEVMPFISDMAEAYSACDLVISRSGALTVAEIAAAGLPAMLVPYPHAVDDHQRHNARYLAEGGAAWLIPQEAFDPDAVAALLGSLDRGMLRKMGEKARELAKTDATGKVAEICMEMAA